VRSLGERGLLLVGQIGLLAGFLGIAVAANAWLVTILLAPFSFGRGVSEPSLQALTTRFGEARIRGRLLGLYQSARSLALIFGPLWAGYAFGSISPRAVFYTGAGFVLIALVLSVILMGRPMPTPQARRRAEGISAD
jgi:MFS family permease